MYTKKIVIIEGGFAGINIVRELMHCPVFHITLVDKNNYNFFPTLLYQVATGFLGMSSVDQTGLKGRHISAMGNAHRHKWLQQRPERLAY